MFRLIPVTLMVVGLFACSGSGKGSHTDLQQASTNFNSTDLDPFFRRIQPLFESGLSSVDIDQMVTASKSIGVDQEKKFEFTVLFSGKEVPLKVQIVMDDINSPDVYFHSTAEVAERIQKEMVAYTEERGR